MDNNQEIQISPEDARAFVDRMNSDGEVTPEKRNAWALIEAYNFVEDKIDRDERFSEDDIKKAHSLLARNIPKITKGEYSRNNRSIVHGRHDVVHFPHPDEVPELMRSFSTKFEQYMRFLPEDPKQATRVVDHAAEIMLELVKIHPFGDGNGRLSRLLADAVLLSGGLYKMPNWLDPEIESFKEQRTRFFNSIRVAENGDMRLLTLHFVKQQLAALHLEMDAINANSQARSEAEFSGYSDERVQVRNALENYEEALVENIALHPPQLPLVQKGHTKQNSQTSLPDENALS